MSQIKLKHSGGNSVIIAAPDSNPASDRTLKLPSDADGTMARTLDVAFKSYAIICDQKTSGTHGGTFTSGDWRTRDLNTEISDVDGIVSISSNQFTLQAGTYLVVASAPAFVVDRHMIRMMNETDGTVVEYGTSEYTNSSDGTNNRSFLKTRFTISGAKDFEISHRCQTTRNSDGFGVNSGGNFTVNNEKYTIVEIYKEV